jgi:hypothetical protein
MKTGSGVNVDVEEHEVDHDRDYAGFLKAVRDNFAKAIKDPATKLFSVGNSKKGAAEPKFALFDFFLSELPAHDRQVHECSTCRSFFKHYGNLVTIDERGTTHSVMFDSKIASGYYAEVMDELAAYVETAVVIDVFYSEELRWGTPKTGPWTHMAVTPPFRLVHTPILTTAGQERAARREDVRVLRLALADFDAKSVGTALALLETDSLYRAEAVIGPAKWFSDVMETQANTKNRTRRNNLLWRAVASAPPGWAKPRGMMFGTLIEDIQNGLDFKDVKARFKFKMDATRRLRPTAPPSNGQLIQAERVIKRLASHGSLDRRYARIEELQTVWEPEPATFNKGTGEYEGGVFTHLRTGGTKKGQLDIIAVGGTKTVTYEKFLKDVAPTAQEMQLYVNRAPMNFCAYLTATDEEAPPIIQWDSEDARNAFSWYVYPPGSGADQWNLTVDSWTRVTAISPQPSQWNGGTQKFSHHGEGALFVLTGARDKNHKGCGLGLFPEFMRSDFHPIRKTIEAYSGSRSLTGYENASAGGLRINKNGQPFGDLRVRVTSQGRLVEYHIDRWE